MSLFQRVLIIALVAVLTITTLVPAIA